LLDTSVGIPSMAKAEALQPNEPCFQPQGADPGKRRFLIGATAALGAVGAAAVATPFVASFFPSERAKAAGAPVEIDIGRLEPGQKIDVEWRGKVVWVMKRTPEMLSSLAVLKDKLADPQSRNLGQQPKYAQNDTRSRKPEIFVVVGICTHLGCSPSVKKDLTAEAGGFYCPCHGSKFDYAGRVFRGVPAPTNLEVPPHFFVSDSRILIGEDGKAA
jgi:ubiquinol-cytochrome c reductase iron-sulfur subunit